MPADTCGATRDGLTCDRAPHVDGDHRGYLEERDAAVFWPMEDQELEHLETRIAAALERATPAARHRAALRLAELAERARVRS
jgi:hypothetical protein